MSYLIDYASIIRESVSAIDAAKAYGLEVNKCGFARCWNHKDNHASVKFYEGNRGWHCFSCNAGGSVIDFVSSYFGISFKDAISKINDDFNLNLPIDSRASEQQKRRSYNLRAKHNREKTIRDKLEQNYQEALKVYTMYDKNSRKYAPKSPADDVRPEFVEAMSNLTSAEENLREAELKLAEWKEKCNE